MGAGASAQSDACVEVEQQGSTSYDYLVEVRNNNQPHQPPALPRPNPDSRPPPRLVLSCPFSLSLSLSLSFALPLC